MAYGIVLKTDLSIDVVEHKSGSLLDFCYKNIGCQTIEIVRPKGLDRPYVMVVDEEGLLKGCPVINFVGSYLYETHKHKNPIVGNALILKEIDTEYGADLGFLNEREAMVIATKMSKLSIAAFKAIKGPLEKAGILTEMEG